jgi:hypothetical protein
MAIQIIQSRLEPVAAAQNAATPMRLMAAKNQELWIRTRPTKMTDRKILIPFSAVEA